MTVVDLGAAPGGWVQAAHPCLFPKGREDKGRARRGRILALDLLPLHKSVEGLEGVEFVQGDFLDPVSQSRLMELLPRGGGGVDLVLSDMLANLSGNPLRDAQLSLDLCQAALQFALLHLSPTPAGKAAAEGGKKVKSPVRLVMKSLRSELSPEFERELKQHFTSVNWIKPASSRPESREGFWVCRGFKQPKAVDG
jgi:23S rRNA (uridine2552-2'-O)-methyltransferase